MQVLRRRRRGSPARRRGQGLLEYALIVGVAAAAVLATTSQMGKSTKAGFAAVSGALGTSPSPDFNGDGKPDLAVFSWYDKTVSILLGKGDGRFEARLNYTIAAGSSAALTLGDFNGDGRSDLAIGTQAGAVAVLLGNPDGTFATGPTTSVGSYPGSMSVADFNGDGRPDLVVADSSGVKSYVLLGRGDGSFTVSTLGGTILNKRAVAVADFNGDGRPDLIVAPSSSFSGVSVFLGNGDGTFHEAAAPPDPGSNAYQVVVGDFNADQNPDLAITSVSAPSTASILLGTGSGTFTAGPSATTGNTPYGEAVGDFNGDGRQDLAVTNDGSATVSVLLSVGDGTFTTGSTPGTGSRPRSVAAGDFNGDGRLDLAVANYIGGTVSVLLGRGDGTFNAQILPAPTLGLFSLGVLVAG